MSVKPQPHISELDCLLADLSQARYWENINTNITTNITTTDTDDTEDTLPRILVNNKYGGSLSSLSPPSRYTSPNTTRARMPEREPGQTDEDDGDYDYTSKWEYLGKGIWENQDYGTLSNYSTLKSGVGRDYDTLSRSGVVSEEELERETGAGPRGDSSRYIQTDNGTVQSKYRYMGFGLWENLDPTAPKKLRKPKPPPPPPKAEPIWYNCTVTVSNTVNSKELDDLVTLNIFTTMESRDEWLASGRGDLLGDRERTEPPMDKEDLSDMFGRAAFEKMQPTEDPRTKYNCYVCRKVIEGRVITAMGNKFHPECFVCTYCRGQFRERKYKTDPREGKPYCLQCFEILLGHFGNLHNAHHG